VKTVITILLNVLYMIILEEILILRIYGEIDLNIILYGNTELKMDQNNDMFFARFKFF